MTLPELDNRPVRVATWGRTDPGRVREENQDTFLVMELIGEGEEGFVLDPGGAAPRGGLGREFTLGPRGALFLVADGMGGAAGGALASRTAAERIRESMAGAWSRERNRSPQSFASHLERSVEEANRALYELASSRPDLHGMGTTATAAGLLGGFLYVAQVGDSRAYLIREGVAHQLTRDQSMVQELVDAGALTEAQAERSDQRNVILQALGTTPAVDVDLTYQQLRRGDTLLVCSDGLSGIVRSDELAAHVERFTDPPALCEAMVELANSRGAPDNVTVVVARLDGAGLEPPTAGDSVGRQVFHLDEA